MGIISKIKYFVPDRVHFLLCFAIFHFHITYGLIIWYSTYKTYISKISKLQNRIIKIIAKPNPREKVLPLFKKRGILTLDDLFTYEMAAFIRGGVENTRLEASGGSRKFWWGGGFEVQNLKNSDVFTKIESDFSAEIGNSNVFFAQIQVVSKKKKKK